MFDLILASEEIIVNISNYAYPEGSGDIEVICNFDEVTRKVVAITFVDNGIYFDVRTVKKHDINLSIENRHVGVVGIYLVKSLMDEVLYNRKDNKNIVTIIKTGSN